MSSGSNRWRPDLVPASLTKILTPRPAEAGVSGADWLDQLPHLLGELLEDWGVVEAGPAWAEHVALQHWHGRGAVRLVAADPRRGALLLERLNAEQDLLPLWVDEACEVIGGLLAELHRPASPDLPRVVDFLDPQFDRLTGSESALPRRVVERAISLYRDLRPTADDDARLLKALED